MKRPLLLVLGMLALMMTLGSVQIASAANGQADRYVVVFKDGVSARANVPDVAQAHGLQVGFVYEHALQGMAATVPAGRLNALRNDPRVAYVVQDMERSISTHSVPTGIQRIFADTNPNLAIDGSDDFRVDVDVAVIDTGVDFEHPDLDVVGGVNCATGAPWSSNCNTGGDDDHYHGTHVAGSIAAIDNDFGVVGVAPGARIHAVKVLNSSGSGYTSWIVAGIDWVTANADTIEVANMSLGGSGFNQAEYDAIQGAVNAGVAFAVAAGNSNADANNYSPAAFDNVLTVSALADFNGAPGGGASPTCRNDQDDTLADFSNWGNAVQIAAPGVCILSTFPLEQGSYGTISGTSMASPHVAGALALLASSNNPNNASDVHYLYDQIEIAGNDMWTDDSGDGIKEPLLDVSSSMVFNPVLIPTGGGNAAPTVSITAPDDGDSFNQGETISFAGTANDTEDGDISSSLVWTSSIDNEIGMGGSFSAVLSEGTHTITAEATDSAGASGSDSITITVQAPSGSTIALSVSTRKQRGTRYADLTWSGATSTNVDIHRDGTWIATRPSADGAYTDNLGKGGGTSTWQVCEEGTNICSDPVTESY